MTKTEFIDRAVADPQGQCVVGNLLYACHEQWLTEDHCRSFIEVWMELYEYYLQASAKTALIDALAMLPIAPDDRTKSLPGYTPAINPELRIPCRKRIGHSAQVEKVSTTMPLTTFQTFLADTSMNDELHSSGMLEFGDATESYASFTPGEAAEEVTGQLQDARRLGRDGGLVWFTDATAINDLKASRSGDRMRDRLGLIHLKADTQLVTMTFPIDAVSTVTSGRPTALDAGANRCFKSEVDLVRNQKRSAWGYTADLDRFAQDQDSLDGVPERVCHPIASEDIGAVTVLPLKLITTTRGESADQFDQVFSVRINHGKSVAELTQQLMALL